MLSRFPIDLVEIVVVASDDYKLFQKLQQIFSKLNEPNRIARINDKMTKVNFTNYGIEYRLNNCEHREYNKPSFVGMKYWTMGYVYRRFNVLYRDNDGCVSVSHNGRSTNIYNLSSIVDIDELLVRAKINKPR